MSDECGFKDDKLACCDRFAKLAGIGFDQTRKRFFDKPNAREAMSFGQDDDRVEANGFDRGGKEKRAVETGR